MADEPVVEAGETPWALAKRLLQEGHSRETVKQRLLEEGLAPEDITLLIGSEDAPQVVAAREPGGVSGNLIVGIAFIALGVLIYFASNGMVFAYGLVFVGLVRAVTSVVGSSAAGSYAFEPRRVEQQPLAKDDPAQRCARHVDFASAGTCPRCGSFTCLQCAPPKGYGRGDLCGPCEREPSTLAMRTKTSARWVAGFVAAMGVAAILSAGLDAISESKVTDLLAGLIASAPFFVFGGIQTFVRHWWPSVLALLVDLGLLVLMMSFSGDTVPWLFVGLWLVPFTGTLLAIGRLTERRKAQASVRKL